MLEAKENLEFDAPLLLFQLVIRAMIFTFFIDDVIGNFTKWGVARKTKAFVDL